MDIRQAFGHSLKVARKSKRLSQEDFSIASSRTYLSSLERGLKSPTLDKINALAERMEIHPLTLLTLTYLCQQNETDPTRLHKQITTEINSILSGIVSISE
ncbi:MAG: transcriptional regulator [Sideroxydans sp.]|jgi:transcriptional regulator with XRE-family HTH domain|nr:transcriptional regulator [Sideroxydans sp.]